MKHVYAYVWYLNVLVWGPRISNPFKTSCLIWISILLSEYSNWTSKKIWQNCNITWLITDFCRIISPKDTPLTLDICVPLLLWLNGSSFKQGSGGVVAIGWNKCLVSFKTNWKICLSEYFSLAKFTDYKVSLILQNTLYH